MVKTVVLSRIDEHANRKKYDIIDGSFSKVLLHKNHILKFWLDDPAYDDFLNIKHKYNPISIIKSGFKKKISIDGIDINVVRLEKLQNISKVQFSVVNKIYKHIIQYGLDYILINAYDEEDFLDFLDSEFCDITVSKFIEDNIMFCKTMFNIICDCKKTGWGYDLHPGNVMRRKKDLVIIDPFFSVKSTGFDNLNHQCQELS